MNDVIRRLGLESVNAGCLGVGPQGLHPSFVPSDFELAAKFVLRIDAGFLE